MTAGMTFIIGLLLSGAKMFIIGVDYGDIRRCIENNYPEFFIEVPSGYEEYLNRVHTTDLMNYLANEARAGSAVHLRAFIMMFSWFVEEVDVDDDDLNSFVRKNYNVADFERLDFFPLLFTEGDWQEYINRITPMSRLYN